MKEWQGYALAAFGVAAGQVLKMGRKIEAGEPVTRRDLFVLCSMLPAFGSLIGAVATHYGIGVPYTLALGTSAGWVGFGAMKVVLAASRTFIAQINGPTKLD